MLRHDFRVSERRACRVLKQPRATQRYAPLERDDEQPLTKRIIALASAYGRYGYRRITALLNMEGWRVNHKRVERIWQQQGLRVPRKQPKRGRLWLNDGSCVRLRPSHRDHVWAYDFVQDRTADGKVIRILTVVDEFTRECLAIDVARSLKSDDVLERLAWLMATRGVPGHIRSDNGPEFTARVVRKWLKNVGVRTLFIEPGSPWENGYCESFNSKLRDELLERERFDTLREAKVLIERWRVHYNTKRPHSSLGYQPPAPQTWVGIVGQRKKQPLYIRPKDETPIAFAGLHANWTDKATGEEICTFTICTTEPNTLMKPIHARIPCILAPDDFDEWLKTQTATTQTASTPCLSRVSERGF